MEVFTPYIPLLQSVLWRLVLFGICWQFLRWFILTRWLIKGIEHWGAYFAKLIINQCTEYLRFLVQFIAENGKSVLHEIWKYRAGKIIIGLLSIYLIYIIIF